MSSTYVGVLIGSDGDELRLRKRVCMNRPLGHIIGRRDLDHVDTRLIAVHRV